MNMNLIRSYVESAVDTPILFFGYVMCVFLILVAVGCLITYWAACAVNQKTQMTELMQVSVALNRWPEGADGDGSTMLSLGSYLICMQDPAGIGKNRLDPKLSGLALANCRQYRVSVLLNRFHSAFNGAGFLMDPASRLLDTLLYDEHFCEQLGWISRKNARKGLRVQTAGVSRKEGSSEDKVSVYYEIPGNLAAHFESETHCNARTLCVTLEYAVR